ncbi:MAG: lipoyl(octanoyl) transferase LipB [Phycisphaeraceae bacterium]|nr:lipoyl(octanoyl) transferase LipB [Phycisphaeraceae bacterium]
MGTSLHISDLGRLAYGPAYQLQTEAHSRVLSAREARASTQTDSGPAGELLLVEHDPVVTISNRASAEANLLASPELLARSGVAVARTDRGGDITYHGPGQLVAYPILDLNVLNLGLHDYMRMLEDAVVRVCARFGVQTSRDPEATGVWTLREGRPHAKIAAMGVRVRKWISMHGLALNVTTRLEHFGLIVPCGLVGRPVTSLAHELGADCPSMPEVKSALIDEFSEAIERRREIARMDRDAAAR